MSYVDSHIHLQDYKDKDVKNVVNNAIKNGVKTFVNISSHPSDWDEVQKLALEYSSIIPAFGIHPWYIEQASDNWYETLEKKLKENPRAWVGETGIDTLKKQDVEEQKNFLKLHIKIAQLYNRPLVLHTVKAINEMMDFFNVLPQKTIFHSYVGPVEWGRKIQKNNFYVGINFSILRRKNFAQILQNLDYNRILLETDGPYQAWKKNTDSVPEEIPVLINQIAESINMSPATFTQQLEDNWLRFSGEYNNE